MKYRMSADTEMTPEILSEYIGYHKRDVARRLQALQDAYENRYEIYRQGRKPAYKPDNRVSVNFAKYIVDTFNGFFCGIPVKTETDDEKVAAYLEFLDGYNDQDNNNAELSKLADIHGSAHEMYFIDDDGKECITYLSALDSFFIVEDGIRERPLYFVHYYLDTDNIERGTWSDRSSIQYFRNNGSYVWDGEPVAHGFDDVPASELVDNDEGAGLFESVLPMINLYNKALSEKGNDVDYFADAYLKVLGERLNQKELNTLRDKRIINFYGNTEKNPEVEFLQKPNADTTQENLINRLERLIFQTCMVPNISDDNFGTASGIALRYRLLPMSNLAKTKERKFASLMNRRYRVLFSHPIAQTNGVGKDDWVKIHPHFTQNYPANISDEADTAAKLSGIVSEETQLKVLSIVDNTKEEIGRKEKESEEAQDRQLRQAIRQQNALSALQSGQTDMDAETGTDGGNGAQ